MSSVVPIEPNENTIDIFVVRGSMCETLDAVPTVSSRKDLHVVTLCILQDHVPEIALYGMVNSILRFVDEQETVIGNLQELGRHQTDVPPHHQDSSEELDARLTRKPQDYATTSFSRYAGRRLPTTATRSTGRPRISFRPRRGWFSLSVRAILSQYRTTSVRCWVVLVLEIHIRYRPAIWRLWVAQCVAVPCA